MPPAVRMYMYIIPRALVSI